MDRLNKQQKVDKLRGLCVRFFVMLLIPFSFRKSTFSGGLNNKNRCIVNFSVVFPNRLLHIPSLLCFPLFSYFISRKKKANLTKSSYN